MRLDKLLFAFLAFLAIDSSSLAIADSYILKGATLVQTTPHLVRQPDSHIVIEDDLVRFVGYGHVDPAYADLPTVNVQGKFIVPGLIDSHVHLSSRPGVPYEDTPLFNAFMADYYAQSLQSYLFYGYTSVIDLNANLDHLAELKTSAVRPNIYDCGAGAPVANGYPMVFQSPEVRFRTRPNFIFNADQRSSLPDYVNPENHTAQAVVKRVKDGGGVCFKTFHETGFRPGLNWPVPDNALMQQLRTETRNAGLPLLVHANRESAQKAVADHGIDILVHGMWHWNPANSQRSYEPGTSAFSLITTIADRGIKYMPTLQVLAGEAALFDAAFLNRNELHDVYPPALLAWFKTDAARWYRGVILNDNDPSAAKLDAVRAENMERLRQSARLARHFHENGGTLLFGSDTPSDQTYGNPPGLNGFWEMQQWASAGIPPEAILRAATWDNAAAFNLLDEIGSITTGKRADMLILDKDPTQSVGAFDTIVKVVSRGKIEDRHTFSARRKSD